MNEADLPRIGIDLGGTKIEGVLLDASGGVERRVRRVTPRDDYRGTLDAIANTNANFMAFDHSFNHDDEFPARDRTTL